MITKYIVRIKHKKDINEDTNNIVCNNLKRFKDNLKIIMPDNEVTLQIHQGGVNNVSEEIT